MSLERVDVCFLAAPPPKKAEEEEGEGRGQLVNATAAKGKGGKDAGKEDSTDPPEPNLTPEEVDEKAGQLLPPGMLDQLGGRTDLLHVSSCNRLGTGCIARAGDWLHCKGWGLVALQGLGTGCIARAGDWLHCKGWGLVALQGLGTGCIARAGDWLHCKGWGLVALQGLGTGCIARAGDWLHCKGWGLGHMGFVGYMFIEAMAPSDMKSLLFVKLLEKKPGWKDSNFQVMKAKLSIVALLVAKATAFGRKSALCALPAVVEKLSDVKQSIDTLMVMAEKLSLNFISVQALKCAFEQENPKVHSEMLDWLGQALKDSAHLEFIKNAMGASNPQVRTSAISLLSVMHLYLKAQLRLFFEDKKPTVLQLIDAQFEKSASETAPAPIRGPSVKVDSGEQDGVEGEGGAGGGGAAAPVSLADLMPKVDISGQIKEELITELGDKNWKIRNEAL
eukprot:Em0004g1629a